MSTVRCTMAQALVRCLCNQFTTVMAERVPLFPGVFAIFGHGNVTCLAEALEEVKDTLPTWRGQNEQSMALAALGFAKAKRRRQIMVATSSIGPGAINMVTAAGVAHSNRLPVLLLSGDVFVNRRPDPVLQQVEHFVIPRSPSTMPSRRLPVTGTGSCIPSRSSRRFPRLSRRCLIPAIAGRPLSLFHRTCRRSPATIRRFFEPTVHASPRPRPDRERLAEAAGLLKPAKRPLIIAGGGVRYSGAEEVAGFRRGARHPTVRDDRRQGRRHPRSSSPYRTDRHRRLDLGQRPRGGGGRGARGRHPAAGLHHWLLDRLRPGCEIRLDQCRSFRRGQAPRARGCRRRAGDAHRTRAALDGWNADPAWTAAGPLEFAKWNDALDGFQKPTNNPVPTYAQVVGVVNAKAGERDLLIAAAGGLPGEVIQELARQVAEYVRLRVWLLLHGL